MEQQILHWITQHGSAYGYLIIFLGMVFGIVGLPVPDETLLTFTGYLIYRGAMHFALAIPAALGGSMCGITFSYWLGRKFGMRIVHRYGRYVHLRDEHIQRVHGWFEHIGHWALTLGYFVPGFRHVTAFVAGTSDLPRPQFAIFAYSGAVLWVGTFLSLGYFLGEQWHYVLKMIDRYLLWVTIGGAILAGAYLLWRYWWRRRSRAR
jgi:membrane protein DedA with SNARE-associated domain